MASRTADVDAILTSKVPVFTRINVKQSKQQVGLFIYFNGIKTFTKNNNYCKI